MDHHTPSGDSKSRNRLITIHEPVIVVSDHEPIIVVNHHEPIIIVIHHEPVIVGINNYLREILVVPSVYHEPVILVCVSTTTYQRPKL